MLNIILVRPGTTEYDRQGRIQGRLDLPLTEEGKREAASTCEQLQSKAIDIIYTSPNKAALETAGVIGKTLGLKPKTLDKLQNLDQGLWQGMRVADVKQKQPKVFRKWQQAPEHMCPPSGETVADAKARIQQVVTKLLKKHREGVIALVLPEPVATMTHNILRGEALADLWKLDSHASWEAIPLPTGAPAAG